jgi:hypothetical protein
LNHRAKEKIYLEIQLRFVVQLRTLVAPKKQSIAALQMQKSMHLVFATCWFSHSAPIISGDLKRFVRLQAYSPAQGISTPNGIDTKTAVRGDKQTRFPLVLFQKGQLNLTS